MEAGTGRGSFVLPQEHLASARFDVAARGRKYGGPPGLAQARRYPSPEAFRESIADITHTLPVRILGGEADFGEPDFRRPF